MVVPADSHAHPHQRVRTSALHHGTCGLHMGGADGTADRPTDARERPPILHENQTGTHPKTKAQRLQEQTT